MQDLNGSAGILRFGAFEVDLKTGEVRKHGLKIRLQEQSFQILAMLLERPGEVVTRDQLHDRLWSTNTFVDFDHSLSAAINKLRAALSDSAENPRFVETLPRRGYRFIAPVSRPGEHGAVRSPPANISSPQPVQRQWGVLHRRILSSSTALIFLAGAVALGVWFGRSRARVSDAPLIAIPLTSYPGHESEPAFSPDGKQVAFCWDGDKQDNVDIYVKLIGTGQALRLTKHPARDCGPSWSPDGRSIAFHRELPGGRIALMLISALGGGERKIGEISTFSCSPAWYLDGKQLVIVDRSSGTEPDALFVLSIDTGEKRKLTMPPSRAGGDSCPSFSPDGRNLAFVRSASAEDAAPPGPEIAPYEFSDLYVLRMSSSVAPIESPKRLTFDHRFTGRPAWTADGHEIVYCSGTLYSQSLWRIPANGSGQPQQLASLGNGVRQPAISRDGSRLAYMRHWDDTNIWRVKVPGPHDTTRASTIGGTPFISSTQGEGMPQFSPDGNRIVFSSARSSRAENYEIFVCDSDGSNVLQLTSLGALAGAPHWSPDGERIAFDSEMEGNWAIYVIRANGGKPHRITTDTAHDDAPNWSRDGHWIYFASSRTGEDQVWKIPAQGGKPVQVTRKGGVTGFESPDGKFFYYGKGRYATSLWKVPVDGGEETQVLESLVRPEDFAVVDAGIYFIPARHAITAVSSVQFYSFATGKTRLIATTGNRAENGLTISPDGQWILFTQVDHSATELMLVENFR